MPNSEIIDGYEFRQALEPDELREARMVHHDVFLGEKYIDCASSSGMIDDKYVTMSSYFYCRTPKGHIIGVVRQINGSPLGVPTLNDFEIWSEARQKLTDIPWSRIVEIGSLAVIRDYNKIAEGLYRQIWQQSKLSSHIFWVASIDNRLLRFLRSRRGFAWEDAGETKHYLGSPTTPVIADLREQPAHMKEKAPRFFQYIDGPIPEYLYSSN